MAFTKSNLSPSNRFEPMDFSNVTLEMFRDMSVGQRTEFYRLEPQKYRHFTDQLKQDH